MHRIDTRYEQIRLSAAPAFRIKGTSAERASRSSRVQERGYTGSPTIVMLALHSRTESTDRPISLDGNDKLPASVVGVLFVAATVTLYALAAWLAWELWQLL
jgi:hypothetical protein